MNGHASGVELLLADPRVDPADDDNQAIKYASMEGAILISTDFTLADCSYAIFFDAKLNDAIFHQTKLFQTYFCGKDTDLTNTDFTTAILDQKNDLFFSW
jgi:uncharacterized protein YjbI with pentapeptide repeats